MADTSSWSLETRETRDLVATAAARPGFASRAGDAHRHGGDDRSGDEDADRRIGDGGRRDENGSHSKAQDHARCDPPFVADDEVPPETAESDHEPHEVASVAPIRVAAVPYGLRTRTASQEKPHQS